MQYKECPNCGAHLDPCERCDCQEKEEDASVAAETPSRIDANASNILSDNPLNVNDSLHLREICERTNAKGKEIALVVREKFPKFNRQLLAQCQASEKYGIVIHPDGLQLICDTYDVSMPQQTTAAPEETKPKPKRPDKRKLPRKLTFRMTMKDYARLVVQVEKDGFDSVQAWLYDKVMKLLEET